MARSRATSPSAAMEMLKVDARRLRCARPAPARRSIIEHFDGGPVGVESLAAALSEERGTIEDVLEPFLIQQGFLMRTARGRMVTSKGVSASRPEAAAARAVEDLFAEEPGCGIGEPGLETWDRDRRLHESATRQSMQRTSAGSLRIPDPDSRLPTFPWPVRVYWEDTDAGGVVYHAQLPAFSRTRAHRMAARARHRAAAAARRSTACCSSCATMEHRVSVAGAAGRRAGS